MLAYGFLTDVLEDASTLRISFGRDFLGFVKETIHGGKELRDLGNGPAAIAGREPRTATVVTLGSLIADRALSAAKAAAPMLLKHKPRAQRSQNRILILLAK